MARRTVLLLSVLVAVCGATPPANAAPDQSTCALYSRPTTTARICVDVVGSQRGVYVEAAGAVQPVRLAISSATTYQCNNNGIPSQCSVIGTGGGQVSGFVLVSWSGAHGSVAFGHTYRACAHVTVNDEVYGTICSGTRAN